MTRSTATLLTFVALLASAAAGAQTPPSPAGGDANFAAHKQKELAKIQQHQQVLQTLQSCVNAATTHDAVKQCNETAHSAMGQHGKKC